MKQLKVWLVICWCIKKCLFTTKNIKDTQSAQSQQGLMNSLFLQYNFYKNFCNYCAFEVKRFLLSAKPGRTKYAIS